MATRAKNTGHVGAGAGGQPTADTAVLGPAGVSSATQRSPFGDADVPTPLPYAHCPPAEQAPWPQPTPMADFMPTCPT